MRERVNALIATETLAMSAVVGSAFGGKQGAKHLNDFLRRLLNGE